MKRLRTFRTTIWQANKVKAQLATERAEKESSRPLPIILPIGMLKRRFPTQRPPIIDGLVRAGESINFIGGTKSNKSWLIHHLLLSAALGRPWLGFNISEPIPVLLLDNELQPEELVYRIDTVANALGVKLKDCSNFLIMPLRGKHRDIDAIANRLSDSCKDYRPMLVGNDALYRCLPSGVDENSNSDLTYVFNTIDGIMQELGCAWVNVHHQSKGSQVDKSITDVGAGAGAIARAADAHIILRPHEEDGTMVMEGACRSFPPIQPIGLRWRFPLWVRDDNVDTARLRGRRTPRKLVEPITSEAFAERFIVMDPRSRDAILIAAEAVGYSRDKAASLLRAAIDDGHAHQHRRPAPGQPATFARGAKPQSTSKADAVRAYLHRHPDASVAKLGRKFQVHERVARRLKAEIRGRTTPKKADLEKRQRSA